MFYLRLILRGFVCFVIGLCVLELCARLDDALTDGAPFFGPYRVESLMTYDEFGITGKPYAHHRQWQLNSQGNRGPEVRWDREHIICIGASETFGFAESPNMEYPRQLEREMNARAGCDRYQVLNVSHPGQTIVNFSRRTDAIAAEFRPQIAVIYPSPIFYVYGPSYDAQEVVHLKEVSGFEPRITGKIFNLLETLPEWALTMRYRYRIWKATRHTPVMQRIPEANVERFERDLGELLDHLQRNHIEPVLVTNATRFGKRVLPQEHLALLSWRNNLPNLAEPGFLDTEDRLNNAMRNIAAVRNIALVDAAEELSGRENFTDCVHFTDRGAHTMAKLIADKLGELQDLQLAGCSRMYISQAKSSSAASAR